MGLVRTSTGRFNESTDDAYVNGNVVEITPLVTGTVVSIGADDGDLVHEGQVLINFDPNDAAVGLQSAQANLARTVRQVRGLYSNVDGMKAQVNAQKADVQTAEDNYNRRKTLAQGGAISQEELSHARDSLTAAKNALTNLEQQLKTSNALVDDTGDLLPPGRASRRRATAPGLPDQCAQHPDRARHRLCRQAHRATGPARAAGHGVDGGDPAEPAVDRRQLQRKPNCAICASANRWTSKSDIYGSDVKFSGTIDSLGAGTGSAFALLPAQNATGNWIKIVQRVPVRIHVNAEELTNTRCGWA